MKFSNLIIYRFAKWALIIAGSVSLLSGLVLFLAMLFNFKPYFVDSDGSAWGYLDYGKGIPVKARVGKNIPDTILQLQFDTSGNSSSYATINVDRHPVLGKSRERIRSLTGSDEVIHGDTSFISFSNGEDQLTMIHGAGIEDMTFYVQPRNFGERTLFFLPPVLQLLLVAWCAFQLGLLLESIFRGSSFSHRNYLLLSRTGWGIVIVQVVLWLIGLLWPFDHVNTQIHSTVPGFRQYVDLSATVESPFDLQWMIAGCIILVLAKAFQAGQHLQKEQDLTI